MLIGYARCSTGGQDLDIQRARLIALGVPPDRIYSDHGFSGADRRRPALEQALAVLRPGDQLVVPALDRLGRSVVDLCKIAAELGERGAVLNIGGSVYDPEDPFGRMFFHVMAAFAEFERNLMIQRTREGTARARAAGKYRGKPPKLNPAQRAHLLQLRAEDTHSIGELCDLFQVGRSTLYREFDRQRATTPPLSLVAETGAA